MSNANLFGTFLDAFNASSAARKLNQSQGATSVDAMMKQLLSGPQDVKDLVSLTGNSVGQLLEILDKAKTAGWVAYDDQKRVTLTTQGEQIARLIP